MIQAISPSALREQGYPQDTLYRLYEQISIIHMINKWLARNHAALIMQAGGIKGNVIWLKRTDVIEFATTDIDAALAWFRKMGWNVTIENRGSPNHVEYYVFDMPKEIV